ncbi:MAG: heterodisulfide reductase-related iron-sulfur binding cluster [Nitrospinota bacterium]
MDPPSIFSHDFKRKLRVCLNCGRCDHLCPMFSRLREVAESRGEGEAPLSDSECLELIELCYDCKLCIFGCPERYDIPEEIRRAKARGSEAFGRSVCTRLLMNPERLGKVGGSLWPFSNYIVGNPLSRWVADKLLGIAKERPLPRFARQSLRGWFEGRGQEIQKVNQEISGKAALFAGCYTMYFEPSVAIMASEMLGGSGLQVVLPEQGCCGLPRLVEGDIEGALEFIRDNLATLGRVVREGYDLVTPCNSCAVMLCFEYPDLVRGDEARLISDATCDIIQYMALLHQKGKLPLNLRPQPARVAYYVSCHRRVLQVGAPALALLQMVPKLEIETVDAGCCGFGGTWGFQKKNYEISLGWGKELFEELKRGAWDAVVTECALCREQIREGTGLKVLHPLELMLSSQSTEARSGSGRS